MRFRHLSSACSDALPSQVYPNFGSVLICLVHKDWGWEPSDPIFVQSTLCFIQCTKLLTYGLVIRCHLRLVSTETESVTATNAAATPDRIASTNDSVRPLCSARGP